METLTQETKGARARMRAMRERRRAEGRCLECEAHSGEHSRCDYHLARAAQAKAARARAKKEG